MVAVKSKRAHQPDNRLLLKPDCFGLWFGKDAPYLLYANMEFNTASAKDTGKLLDCERALRWGGWTDAQILAFLKKQQEEFRKFLTWAANGCVVDLGERNADRDDLREMWEKVPEVKFLRQHGFEHAGVTIEPYSGRDGSYPEYFPGIQMGQKKPRDPLDPIVWDVIAHLSVWGTVSVRRCRYWACGRFFQPATKRKRFCTDSCRALAHVPDDVSEPEEAAAFRERRRIYMQDHRQNPIVKKRAPKSQSARPRRDYSQRWR